MHPLVVVIAVAGAVAAFCWIASQITRDHSWVDRQWSIVPVVYVWIFAGAAGFADARLNLMAGLVTLWGARLTYNFARKGGYSGVEDYRWPILRERFGPARFAVFNVFFVVLYQHALLVLITLPALTAFEHRGTPVGILDFVVALAFLLLLAGETVADQQQWDFHQAKSAAVEAGREPAETMSESYAISPSARVTHFLCVSMAVASARKTLRLGWRRSTQRIGEAMSPGDSAAVAT